LTKPPAPLRTSLPAPRPGRRTPAGPTTVVALKDDLEARPREQLKAELVALIRRDTTLVLDLHGATFLGAGAARLLLDLHSQAAAGGGRLVLWRPQGQPFRTLRIARLERILDLRPASWRPPPSMDPSAPQPERQTDLRAG
jgi:anti-anti-sigma factor